MSAENGVSENGEMNGRNSTNSNGNEEEVIQFRKKDGIEKNGYMCFPLEKSPGHQHPKEDDKPAVEREEEEPVKPMLQTCPEDPRFQQTNRTTWCYRMFVDYHRCRNLLGDGAPQCDYFYRCYKSICPNEWHERWTEQLNNGTFPYDFTRERYDKAPHHKPQNSN